MLLDIFIVCGQNCHVILLLKCFLHLPLEFQLDLNELLVFVTHVKRVQIL